MLRCVKGCASRQRRESTNTWLCGSELLEWAWASVWGQPPPPPGPRPVWPLHLRGAQVAGLDAALGAEGARPGLCCLLTLLCSACARLQPCTRHGVQRLRRGRLRRAHHGVGADHRPAEGKARRPGGVPLLLCAGHEAAISLWFPTDQTTELGRNPQPPELRASPPDLL